MTRTMERRRVNLSGSKTRLEKTLKKSGTVTAAASHPASMTRSQKRLRRFSTGVAVATARVGRGFGRSA